MNVHNATPQNQEYIEAERKLETERETSKNRMKFISTVFVCLFLIFLLCSVLTSKEFGPLYEKAGKFHHLFEVLCEVIGIVGLIEFLSHWIFSKLQMDSFKLQLKESQLKTEEVLSNKSDEISKSVTSTRELLEESAEKIVQKIQENITSSEQINHSGIVSVETVVNYINFLTEAYLNVSKSQESKIRLLVTYIEELSSETDGIRTEKIFEGKIRELLKLGNVKIEIIIPNFKSEKTRNLVGLRAVQTGESDRIRKIETTYRHLASIKSRLISDFENAEDKFSLFVHDGFIGFPLLSYNDVWYQGHYLQHKSAEDTKYIKYLDYASSVIPFGSNYGSSLADDIKKHYQGIREDKSATMSFKDFEEISYHHKNAGEYLNSFLFQRTSKKTLPKLLMENSSYYFYTHSSSKIVGDSSKKHSHNHFLSKNVIKVLDFHENCYMAELHSTIRHKDKDTTIKLTGTISYDETAQNLLMIFYHCPQSHSVANYFHAPVIISGKFNEDEIISGNPDSRCLLLHFTFVSHRRKSNTSQIGIMALIPVTTNEVKSEIMNMVVPENLMPNNDNDENLKYIRLFLMRLYKVQIKTPQYFKFGNLNSIVTNDDIATFLNKRFEGLGKHAGKYTLYYPKSNIASYESINDYGSAEIQILENGIIEMNLRKIARKGDESEMYFGEINIQLASKDNPIVSIKLIHSEKVTASDTITDYRELFLYLFWYSDANREFQIARGIALADRDEVLGSDSRNRDKLFNKRNEHKPILEANQCVLVKQQPFEDKQLMLDIIGQDITKELSQKIDAIRYDKTIEDQDMAIMEAIQFYIVKSALERDKKIELHDSRTLEKDEIHHESLFIQYKEDGKDRNCRFIDYILT